jgi:hypothetical protein
MRAASAISVAALALPGIERVEIHHSKANVASAESPEGLGFKLIEERAVEATAPGKVGVELVWRLEEGE